MRLRSAGFKVRPATTPQELALELEKKGVVLLEGDFGADDDDDDLDDGDSGAASSGSPQPPSHGGSSANQG